MVVFEELCGPHDGQRSVCTLSTLEIDLVLRLDRSNRERTTLFLFAASHTLPTYLPQKKILHTMFRIEHTQNKKFATATRK